MTLNISREMCRTKKSLYLWACTPVHPQPVNALQTGSLRCFEDSALKHPPAFSLLFTSATPCATMKSTCQSTVGCSRWSPASRSQVSNALCRSSTARTTSSRSAFVAQRRKNTFSNTAPTAPMCFLPGGRSYFVFDTLYIGCGEISVP